MHRVDKKIMTFSGKSGMLRSFLIARGEVGGIEDSEGLLKFCGILGEPQDPEQLKVNLDWGKEKESFAILAAKRKLLALPSEEVRETDEIWETGFTSCIAHR